MRVHCVHQHSHALRRRELADAVAQIEDVRGACGGRIGVRLAKRVQHPPCLLRHSFWRRKQGIGVEVALQRFALTPHLAAHFSARSA